MDKQAMLTGLLEQYLDQVDELIRHRKPQEGILGMGGGPQAHPCHEQMDTDLDRMVRSFADEGLTQEEAAVLTQILLLDEDLSHGVQCSDLMLQAVQRHSEVLIPFLAPQDAAALLKEYSRRYPLFKRFPAQKQVLQLLKKQSR